MDKKLKMLILLATVLTVSGLCFYPRMFGSFTCQAIRRSKVSAAGFNYQSLIGMIERGEELIPRTPEVDNILVYSPESGVRNLVCLNAIPLYYRGPQALYWLALDLELAIKEGYIAWQGEFSVFDTGKLNELSDEFLGKLGAQRTVMPYWVFLNLRRELKDVPGRDEFLEKAGGLFREIVTDGPGLNRLIRIAQSSTFIANYLRINQMVEECYRIYGTEARRVSEGDLRRYGEYLNDLDEQVRVIFQQLNDLIVSCAVSTSPGFQEVILQAQRDLLLLLDIISAYKKNELREISATKHLHYFSPKNRGCSEIFLELHDVLTRSGQASIRWDIRRFSGEVISLRLDRVEWENKVCLDISSPALNRIYRAVRKPGGHHFGLEIPGLDSEEIFKTLVRIFY